MPARILPLPGQPLPQLRLQFVDGSAIDLAAQPGWRLLVVYRGRHCPACAKYLARLQRLHPRLRAAGVAVFALSADPAERAGEQAREAGWSFRVAHGLRPDDMRRLGLFVSAASESDGADRPFAEPGLYIVDPRGRLRAIDVSNVPFSRPDLADIAEGIETLQKDDPPIHGTA